jgi:hypothetical protein
MPSIGMSIVNGADDFSSGVKPTRGTPSSLALVVT